MGLGAHRDIDRGGLDRLGTVSEILNPTANYAGCCTPHPVQPTQPVNDILIFLNVRVFDPSSQSNHQAPIVLAYWKFSHRRRDYANKAYWMLGIPLLHPW